jgi:3-dehydroquinate synthase
VISTLRMRLPRSSTRSYPILIGSGVLGGLPRLLSREYRGRKIFVISDFTVQRLYGRTLLKGLLEEGFDALSLDFRPGESSKNAATVFALHGELLAHGVRRDSVIIALGGGVVGDVAGFVAATVLRGIRIVQAPTTLLAQVDSSVGGKNGIDHPLGKNLIGSFHQPSAVYIDPDLLRTLPAREFRNGLAEVVKIAAALDPRLFARLERVARRLHRGAGKELTVMIRRSVALKAAVVEKDEREAGIRKILNLGHTLGHAVELQSGFSLRHGEAVAIGLVEEARIAAAMGFLDARAAHRVERLVKLLGLPTRFPRRMDRKRFLSALSADKKSEGDTQKYVLLRGIGRSIVGVEVPTPFLMERLPQEKGR